MMILSKFVNPPRAVRASSIAQRAFFSFGNDFASPEDVHTALEDPRTIILDVRQPDEIQVTGYWKVTKPDGEHVHWRHMPCSPMEAHLLEATAHSLLKDKTAPVLVHCASGRRSSKAKEVLESLGYENVSNVGGWPEVEKLLQK